MARGYELLSEYAGRVGIPASAIGALLVAWTTEQGEALPEITANARSNGVQVRRVGVDELYRREPSLGPGAHGGLEVPAEGILCPFTATLALATEAVLGGCTLALRAEVAGVSVATGADGSRLHRLRTARGDLMARFIVNAAGLRSDEVNAMLGHGEFQVRPRRGELIVYDKLASGLLRHVLLPVPTAKTKGVLVSPTAYGNVLLGPTADDVPSKTDRATTADGLASLLAQGERILPGLGDYEVTATYVGLRAATEDPDYQLRFHPEQRYVCAGGIRSTGVTAAMGIAEHVREGLADAGLELAKRPRRIELQMPNIGELDRRPYQRADLIAADPAMGRIACFCERATRGEIAGCAGEPDPAGRPRRPAPADPGADGPLPGVLLCGRGRGRTGGRRRRWLRRS